MYKGIDLSKHNGKVDFAKVKANGIDFVILRAGFGKVMTQKDPMFEEYYSKAKSVGLDVGAYWYSYAQNVPEAAKEAQCCVEAIKGKRFEYPIYFDLEEQKQLSKGKAFCSELIKTFCLYIEEAGYWAGFYTSRSVLQTNINDRIAKRFAVWIAEWSDRCKYTGEYGIWQYSEKGQIDGINGYVDLDNCYVDYPAAIKRLKLNGYKEKRYIIEIGGLVGGLEEQQALKELEYLRKHYPHVNMREVT